MEPPPSTVGNEPALIKMGFPSHASSESASLGLCMCHLDTTSSCKLTTSGFLCPQVKKTCIFFDKFKGHLFSEEI